MATKDNPLLAELAGVDLDTAKRDAFRQSFPRIPDTQPTLHQQLLNTIETLLKKHEAHHNSVEHAAARALLRKIRGEA